MQKKSSLTQIWKICKYRENLQLNDSNIKVPVGNVGGE